MVFVIVTVDIVGVVGPRNLNLTFGQNLKRDWFFLVIVAVAVIFLLLLKLLLVLMLSEKPSFKIESKSGQ